MHRLLVLPLVLLIPHGTFSTAGAGAGRSSSSLCDRRCGGVTVPYPFGFSAGCPIALSCDASTSVPVLAVVPSGGQSGNTTTTYRVVSFNTTRSAMLVSFLAACAGRSVGEARRALSGANYGVSSRTGLLLRGGCRSNASSAASDTGICNLPEYVMSGLLRKARCPGVNDTASLTCISSTPSSSPPNATGMAAPGTTTGSELFLHWEKAVSSNCNDALSSIVIADTPEGTPSLELGVAELGWWANGTCAGGEPCVPNAACSDVRTPDGGQGHRCACKAGMSGDGFLAGDGCYRGTPGSGHVKKTRKIYIIASTSGTFVLSLLFFSIFLGYKIYKSTKKLKETPGVESFLQKNRNIHPKRYTYAQVKRMTKTFAEKLGQGGFGVVYRGGLSDGRQVAVKMLKDSKADMEEFINEVSSISRTSHVNVVTLLGFCLEGSKRALIYDYMPNGSLEKYAFKGNSKGENTLGWQRLFDIAVGIARGLEYLHRGCNTRIVHFDIKPHNILLDQDFCPKISDFGLAKLCPNKESVISIGGARGTVGYIAPEVFSKQFGTVSSKSDVYSYGMMLLEMVGARNKNMHANSESSSQYFPEWIYQHLDEYCVSASDINCEDTEIVRKMIVIGLWCTQLGATNRPTMTRVVEMLEGSTSSMELPPQVLLSQ